MEQNGLPICDVCGAEIPEGTKYKRATMAPRAAELLRLGGPDLTPTWTTNADGTVSLDICTTCVLSMGPRGNAQ
jgi:hypothetical protein